MYMCWKANRLDRRPACRTRRGRTRLRPEVRDGVVSGVEATGSGAASNGAEGDASAACDGEATTGGGAGG